MVSSGSFRSNQVLSDPIRFFQIPSGSFRVLLTHLGSFNLHQVTWGVLKCLKLPLGSFRFLQGPLGSLGSFQVTYQDTWTFSGSGQGVCPGPTMLDRCLACFSRNQGQLMIGETVDIDLTFTCRTFRWGFFGRRRRTLVDIKCMESEDGMTTSPRP